MSEPSVHIPQLRAAVEHGFRICRISRVQIRLMHIYSIYVSSTGQQKTRVCTDSDNYLVLRCCATALGYPQS